MPDIKKAVEESREQAYQGGISLVRLAIILLLLAIAGGVALGALGLGAVADLPQCTGEYTYTTHAGDTLGSVAQKFSTSTDKIREMNGSQHLTLVIKDKRTGELEPGRWLKVPCP